MEVKKLLRSFDCIANIFSVAFEDATNVLIAWQVFSPSL